MKITESKKQLLFALVAIALLVGACEVFGQDVQARSFKQKSDLKYDFKHYFNVALIIQSDGQLEETDSIYVLIREKDDTKASAFTVCEKTDLYLAYDKCYIILIHRKGYATTQLSVNAGVKVKQYGGYVPINLQKGDKTTNSGLVVWDSRINDVHYYPEAGGFVTKL